MEEKAPTVKLSSTKKIIGYAHDNSHSQIINIFRLYVGIVQL
jgi:hypothetical protein